MTKAEAKELITDFLKVSGIKYQMLAPDTAADDYLNNPKRTIETTNNEDWDMTFPVHCPNCHSNHIDHIGDITYTCVHCSRNFNYSRGMYR